MTEHNLIKEARQAAKDCRDFTKKILLNRLTDDLQNAFGMFTVSCSREDMSALVGAWTRVILAMNDLPVKPPVEEKLTG